MLLINNRQEKEKKKVECEKNHVHCFLFFNSETSRAAHSRNLFQFKIQNRLQRFDLLSFGLKV